MNWKRLIMIFCFIVLFTLIFIFSFKYGHYMGFLETNYIIHGNEKQCEQINKTMEENYCIILPENNQSIYKNDFNCSWGQFRLYTEYKHIKYSDPRIFILSCKLINSEKLTI